MFTPATTVEKTMTVPVTHLFKETKLKVAIGSVVVITALATTGSWVVGVMALIIWMTWGLFMYTARLRSVALSLASQTFRPMPEDKTKVDSWERRSERWVKSMAAAYPLRMFVPVLVGKKLSMNFVGPKTLDVEVDILVDGPFMTVKVRELV